ncbi:hypothetical protein B0H11DRAFT_2045974 [Mycena galericulata]|nr:hypothetical protein B0H11DRAFT_2045974 [Mycena galericulata]
MRACDSESYVLNLRRKRLHRTPTIASGAESRLRACLPVPIPSLRCASPRSTCGQRASGAPGRPSAYVLCTRKTALCAARLGDDGTTAACPNRAYARHPLSDDLSLSYARPPHVLEAAAAILRLRASSLKGGNSFQQGRECGGCACGYSPPHDLHARLGKLRQA